jgi:Zn-dependent protease
MAFITIMELIDMAVTIAFVGFIFSDMFPKRQRPGRVEDMYKPKKAFDWEAIKFAMMVTGPALILHELSHKFLAMGFGMQATYQAAYSWLVLGLLLKLVNFGFIVIVPAFVNIVGNGTALQFALIAVAGPLMNLALWLGLEMLLKKAKLSSRNHMLAFFGKEINKFLFIFNMIPIPGFDGFKFFTGLLQAFGIRLF